MKGIGAKEASNDSERTAQAGIVDTRVYRTVDGSGVIVTHTFNNLEDAQKHKDKGESAEFQAMIEKMGGAPPYAFWLAEEVDIS